VVASVAVETAEVVTIRPYPKTRAGRRTVPLPPFVVDALRSHAPNEDSRHGLVFPSRATGPMRRSNFRRRVWLPSLVRAGLLGDVQELGPERFRATWPTRAGGEGVG
jgi:integrase